MGAYYNEHDPRAAAWLRELIASGSIAPGHVDERDIRLVRPGELEGFDQCHFFAGIGGWSYALRVAGWPDDKPVWTGSCPCQPFSISGKKLGTADARHLWPQFRRLIRKRRPAVVFGEQVASADGRQWLSGVFADLEALVYRAAGADLCAAGVGAPHIRQRLYWVADTAGIVLRREPSTRNECGHGKDNQPAARLGHSDGSRLQARTIHLGRQGETRCASPWEVFERAGWGRTEPGVQPLADGIPERVGRLRGYGNAIVPQVAARFIEAYLQH